MMIHEKRTPVDREKEMKIKLPMRHHVHLHAMKVLTGKQICDTVAEALDAYFAAKAAELTSEQEKSFVQAAALECDRT